jgi:DNA polymerase V
MLVPAVDRNPVPIDLYICKIVVCALKGELTVKRLAFENQQWRLVAANPDYPDIAIHEGLEAIIWGVVTASIHLI